MSTKIIIESDSEHEASMVYATLCEGLSSNLVRDITNSIIGLQLSDRTIVEVEFERKKGSVCKTCRGTGEVIDGTKVFGSGLTINRITTCPACYPTTASETT